MFIFEFFSANQRIEEEIRAMERELSETSMRLRRAAEEKLERDEARKRNEAMQKEQDIKTSDLADDEKEKLLKEHKAYTEKLEVSSVFELLFKDTRMVCTN